MYGRQLLAPQMVDHYCCHVWQIAIGIMDVDNYWHHGWYRAIGSMDDRQLLAS